MADYSFRMTRETPGYFIFLLDQSYSMTDTFAKTGEPLCVALADMINNWLEEMVSKATEDSGNVKNWFDISVLGYRTDGGGESITEPAFVGNLSGRKRVSLSEIAENIFEMERKSVKWFNDATGELDEAEIEKPVWVKPIAEGGTPLCNALHDAYYLVEEWINESDHDSQCFPPIVINITDAELNSGDGDPVEYADPLTSLGTQDGSVLLFNCQITCQNYDALFCPGSAERLPNDEFAAKIFEMSSLIPESMLRVAAEDFPDLTPQSRGMVYNGDNTSMIKLFNFGTMVAGLR